MRIYLDFNASTPVAPEVATRMEAVLHDPFGNPSSGHWAGASARDAVETARAEVAALLGCHAGEVVFTSGGSEANNHAIKGAFYARRLELAREHEWSIRYVLDTHLHADHLSRARELARTTGAVLLLPPQHRARFGFTPISDGEQIQLGAATLRALHTPGHTNESTSYLLNEAALFTGDTLFTNGVGRPDLHASADEARGRARSLFASLERLRTLSSDVVVLPAHTSEPMAFDRQPIAARMGGVTPWLARWLTSESAFVERVTSNLPPTPPHFVRIVDLNEAGDFPAGDPTELEAGANRCAVT